MAMVVVRRGCLDCVGEAAAYRNHVKEWMDDDEYLVSRRLMQRCSLGTNQGGRDVAIDGILQQQFELVK